MNELIINTHMHTRFSDGTGSHKYIAEAALKAGLDGVIVTDHNIWVKGAEKYYEVNGRKVIVLVGEEVHDQDRVPQKNHLLIFNTEKEMAIFADDPQKLIDAVRQRRGLCFFAHPHDPPMPLINEPDISWVDDQVKGFTGMEIWNDFSEFKARVHSFLDAIILIFNPRFISQKPFKEALEKWDVFISRGIKVVAIGSSDAHELEIKRGFIKRPVFPYSHHFLGINNHLLTTTALTGNFDKDKKIIYSAFQRGHLFIGYDRPDPTFGFRFSAVTEREQGIMGDCLQYENGATLQINLPRTCQVHLIHNGSMIKRWNNEKLMTMAVTKPGAYRVEAYTNYLGKERGWIFSNPIYLKPI